MAKLERTDLGNFAKCLAQINARKQERATAKQAMQERIKQGENADICTGGFWLPESYSSVNGDVLVSLEEYNPIIPYAQQAVDAHLKEQEFFLTKKVLLKRKPASQVLREVAEEDALKPVFKRRVLICKDKKQRTDIPTKSLGNEEEIIFLARGEKLAGDYGDFLNNSGIKETSIYRPLIIAGKDLTRGFWLCRLAVDGRSDFGGRGCLGGDGGSLFGVCRSGLPRQKILPYTQKQVDKYLKLVQGVRAGNKPASKLEEVAKFLAGLEQ